MKCKGEEGVIFSKTFQIMMMAVRRLLPRLLGHWCVSLAASKGNITAHLRDMGNW
jgi:hypothetical protein